MTAISSKLLYGLVAHGTTVVAEHSNTQGNVNVIALRILENLPQDDMRVSYSQDKYMVHVLIEESITYLCISESAAGRRVPFAFLDDLRTAFLAMYGSAGKEAIAYEYNTDFSPIIAQRMDAYRGEAEAGDAMSRVRVQLEEVQVIMVENIDKVLDRGERLDLLADKTEALSENAQTFRRRARRLQRHLFSIDARTWGVVVIVFLLIAWGIAAFVWREVATKP